MISCCLENSKIIGAAHKIDIEQQYNKSIILYIYIVFDYLKKNKLTWDSKLNVSNNASSQPRSKIYVEEGSSISVNEAVRALIIKSANDVATVVAENISGSEREIAKLMTSYAKKIGMKNTTFKNASGLRNRAQLTTARDIATLSHALISTFPKNYKLFSEKKGAVICMRPKTGEILAYLSAPDYDLNSFAGPVPIDLWNQWNVDLERPLLNRGIQGLYPPGSTFKLIAAALAIEKNIVSKNWTVNCSGVYYFGDRNFHCWNIDGHGEINLDKARVDFDVEGINSENKGEIEEEVNKIIQQDIKIKTKNISREEALNIPDLVRTKPGMELVNRLKIIRIIEIENFDVQADGGTHVNSTKEIGKIEISKIENKGKHNKRIEVKLH